jgi:hypothetical protein
MDLLYSWLGTKKTTYKYGNFQYIFSTSSDGNHPKSLHFHSFFFYFFYRRHFANRNKVGCLVLALHEHFEPNIGQGFNVPGFKCSELCKYPTSSFR